jgi:hypothetical protein
MPVFVSININIIIIVVVVVLLLLLLLILMVIVLNFISFQQETFVKSMINDVLAHELQHDDDEKIEELAQTRVCMYVRMSIRLFVWPYACMYVRMYTTLTHLCM